jgi:hypothetical protein
MYFSTFVRSLRVITFFVAKADIPRVLTMQWCEVMVLRFWGAFEHVGFVRFGMAVMGCCMIDNRWRGR